MFQTKRFTSIVASMINRMRTGTTLITDYSTGAVARVMVEAPAQELDELYQQMVAGLVAAVPVSVYRTFSFDKIGAVEAGGLVRVNITPQPAAVVIPAGTVLTQPRSSVQYRSAVDAVILAGNSYGDVPVVATAAGALTNLAQNTAFAFSRVPAGFLDASNLVAFVNGADEETEAQRKTRFNDFVETLARGTVAALRYGSKDKAYLADANGNVVERVAFVSIDEPYLEDHLQPVGLVHVFVHNGVGGTSAALVARVVQVLHGYYDAAGKPVAGYKAAGVQVVVAAATEQPVPIAGTLSVGPSYDHATLAATAVNLIAAYLMGLDIQATAILAEVTSLVMDIPGVTNFVLDPGQADVPATVATKLMPGPITVR